MLSADVRLIRKQSFYVAGDDDDKLFDFNFHKCLCAKLSIEVFVRDAFAIKQWLNYLALDVQQRQKVVNVN